MNQLLCEYLGISLQELSVVRAVNHATVLSNPIVQRIIASINFSLLRATLPEAQAVLNRELPSFYSWLADDLHVTQVPSTPSHAIEWVEDFLLDRRSIPELVTMHQRLPASVVTRSIPRFIHLFDELTFGRADWQRAAALLCLVLLAPLDSEETDTPTASSQ
jgi:hypothetical protein